MGKDLDSLISRVKAQILHERSQKKGKFRYSDRLRLAVLAGVSQKFSFKIII